MKEKTFKDLNQDENQKNSVPMTFNNLTNNTFKELSDHNDFSNSYKCCQGPMGPEGPKGDKGDKGDVGPRGPKGDQGPEGEVGPQGEKGEPGCKGDIGPQGIPGPAGRKGDQGVAGVQGVAGEPGPQGVVGPQGLIGPQGIKGDTGLQGEKGERGDQGIQGLQGLKGDTGIQGPKGDTGEIGPVGPIGPQGPQGVAGPQGEVGPIGPQGQAGVQGLQGPKGDTGPQGMKGETGATGPQGPQGVAGPQGLQGVPGPTGATGKTGPQGPVGPKGDTGCGIPGPKGDVGPQGPAGNCCDPSCLNTMQQLLIATSEKQASILNNNPYIRNVKLNDAIINYYDKSTLNLKNANHLKQVIIPDNQSSTSNLFKVISSTEENIHYEHVVFPCSTIGVSASTDKEIGKYFKTLQLPSYEDESTCPRTREFYDFFDYLISFGVHNKVSLVLDDNSTISKFEYVTPLEVSMGLLKFKFSTDTKDEMIGIVSLCHITRIWYICHFESIE